MVLNRHKRINEIRDEVCRMFMDGTIRVDGGLIKIDGDSRSVSLSLPREAVEQVVQEAAPQQIIRQVTEDARFR